MSRHLGIIYRSTDSAHSCGWDLLVLSKDNLDFTRTSNLPACGTGKEIELLGDEVNRNGVMVNVAAVPGLEEASAADGRREWMGWEQVHR